MKRLVIMIQFLTRIPININLNVESEDFTEGIKYFPIIGFIIGVILYFSNMFILTRFSYFTAALLSVIIYIYITGGLHMDGLADSADGLFSGRKKDRILEIMKDSRIGSNGALAMIMIILLKIGFLFELGDKMGIALLILPVLSKFNVVFSCKISKYARVDGMGNFFIGKVNNFNFFLALLSTILIVGLVKVEFLFVIPISLFITFLITRYTDNIIGGMTGDTIGGLSELSDVFNLIIIGFFI